ncbi:MAG: SDR family NAD(P)-dependent oxidoreductase, partial [Acidimicrobiales bacterium]
MSKGTLEDKVAVVTGAGRGIGAAIAQELAAAGARVALAARSEEQLQAVQGSIADGRSVAIPTDVSVIGELDRLVETTVREFGGVDILVNNAGLMPEAKQIFKHTPQEWQETMRVNLEAPWYLANRVREHMKARGGGAIVNIASTSGLHHDIGLGLYGISKAALIFLTMVQAKEWARDSIRVNCLTPGIVRTELASSVIAYVEEHGVKPNPLNFVAEPRDVAPLVRFLASDEARYI